MPQWKALIKRLVREVKDVEPAPDENLPIEEYEIRELARTRVILKYSIKVHLFTYVCVNVLLVTINLFTMNPQNSFMEFWGLWVILSWGFLLWIHILLGLSIYFKKLENRIFFITSLTLFYLSFLLIFVNYLTIFLANGEFLWWPWSTGALFIFIAVYAYIVFETDDQTKVKIRVKKELTKIIQQREEHQREAQAQETKSQD